MATTLKVLGQASPSATTETDLYTVPGSTTAVVSSIVIANRDVTAATYRISVSVGGGATANKDYVAYDVSISGNETMSFTIGTTMGAADKMRVYASTANLSFSAFGQENS